MPKFFGSAAKRVGFALLVISGTSHGSWAQTKSAGTIVGGVPGVGAIVGGATSSQVPSGAVTGMAPDNLGAVGQVEAFKSFPLQDKWSLEVGGGVNTQQQTQSSPAGDVNGRVGLGMKF